MQIEPAPLPAETLTVHADLTFGDGFRFGCGFMAAFVMFWVVLTILISLVAGLAFLVAPNLPRLLFP